MLSKTAQRQKDVTFTARWSAPPVNVIEHLANRRDEPLLTKRYPECLMEVKAAAEEIGVNTLVPSEVRHSGASIEIRLRPRSLAEGQTQGRWASTVSPKRYEKCGELNREWQKYSDIVGLSASLLEGKLLQKWRAVVWLTERFRRQHGWRCFRRTLHLRFL